LIRPQPVPDEELSDLPHFYNNIGPDAAREWEAFRAGDQFPMSCSEIPDEMDADFWCRERLHAATPPTTPPRRQAANILPAISIRSRQIAADNLRVGNLIIVDGEVSVYMSAGPASSF
jgi:hypothetical protein